MKEKHCVPGVVQEDVTENIRTLFNFFSCHYVAILRSHLAKVGLNTEEDDDLNEILSLDECFEHALEAVSSEHKLTTYCKRKYDLVEPIECHLDSADGEKRVYHYIPVLKVIEAELKKGDVMSALLTSNARRENRECMTDYCDGSLFQRHELFASGEFSLRLHFYTDEFTVVNPLGSRKSEYKIAAFYFVIGNLPAQYHSQMKHIHLAMLFKHSHLKNHSYGEVLKPLVSDLKKLEHGIQVNTAVGALTVRAAVACVCMDNLSAHQFGGFSTSFRVGRICRYCMATSETMIETDVSTFKLRTLDIHEIHLQAAKADPELSKVYGVTRECPFSELKFFDVTVACPPDLMHDLLEGIVPRVIKLALKKLIDERHFTLEFLNKRIKSFNYGFSDSTDKPVPIPKQSLSKRGLIPGKAVQKMSLLTFLPLLIGHKVPKGNQTWKMFLHLRCVTDIVFAPSIERSWVPYLEHLIKTFLDSFLEIFPGHFHAKMHYLVHYPRFITLYGPLRHVWCMRFKAKHQYFKGIARITRNFVNVTLTLSKRHQMRQCYERLSSLDVGYVPMAAAKEAAFMTLPTSLQESVKAYFDTEFDEQEIMVEVKALKKGSVMYKVGLLYPVALLHAEEIPLFFEIERIINVRGLWMSCGKLLRPTHFLEHEHAYVVKETSDWHSCQPGSEIDHTPLNKYANSKGDITVFLKYRISGNKC
ncbi:uncharacterized protein LOC121837494 [Ixodes scapularis]|uniref:uncharacterized protein LOC121837494 n=1 Tax=Ixodes scapularis TaxID=6945 RepID=UPI001A9D577D|nr:uncharacterized protein LOC121837494 [Ixodes scapularis]